MGLNRPPSVSDCFNAPLPLQETVTFPLTGSRVIWSLADPRVPWRPAAAEDSSAARAPGGIIAARLRIPTVSTLTVLNQENVFIRLELLEARRRIPARSAPAMLFLVSPRDLPLSCDNLRLSGESSFR